MPNENPETTLEGGPQKETPKKKIAGKFDTLEQAVEEGYTGLEKKMHELAEGQSKIVKVIETALSAAPIGSRGRDDWYGRGPANDDIDPAKFLTNPGAIFKERDEKLASKIISSVVDLVGNMNAVNQFKSDNPDLIKHERIVQAFMAETDNSESTANRLKKAGEKAREYLKSLKVDLNASNSNTAPKGSDYVEGPSDGGFRILQTTEAEDKEGEQALLESLRQKSLDMAAHFGSEVKKK